MTSGTPTFGLLVDSLEHDYQTAVLGGVLDASAKLGVSLLCFVGGALEDHDQKIARQNLLYDLVGRDNVDGLMVMSGALANVVGSRGLSRFCDRYRPLPLCSISVELPDTPSVLVDNDAGMREAMEHLLVHHRRRRVAFIRGPEFNDEAERRYGVYREMLSAHGLRLDTALVASGDFHRPSGRDAVRLLLDQRRVEVDALFAADDYMALGAMDELDRRGVRVPEDVAVIGFDDVEDARFCSIPLTTVRQPLREQGKHAVRMLLDELRGRRVPRKPLTLATELVVRRSCGCLHADAPSAAPPSAGAAMHFEERYGRERPLMRAEIRRAARAPGGVAPGWPDELLDALLNDLTGREGSPFLETLDGLTRSAVGGGAPADTWQHVLTALRRQAAPCFEGHAELRERFEDLIHHARELIGSLGERLQAQHRLDVERWSRTLSQTGQALLTNFDVDSMVAAVSEQFPRLGIGSCFVSLYEEGPGTDRALLILAYDAHRPQVARQIGGRFRRSELVPSAVGLSRERFAYVVQPLSFNDETMGFSLMEAGPTNVAVYEALRDQLSAALEGARLVRQVVEKDRERQRLLQYIVDVTPDLHKIQPVVDLFTKILSHAARLFQAEHAFLGILPEPGPMRMADARDGEEWTLVELDRDLVIAASLGRFESSTSARPSLGEVESGRLLEGLLRGQILADEGVTILPLHIRELTLGVLYLEHRGSRRQDVELYKIFSNQVTAAVHNARLYEMAALDPLTGVHARRFFSQWLEQELRTALMSGQPLSLLMLDMDGLKAINDGAGHLAGDEALAGLGRVLRHVTRADDVIGRYGGDEFAVVLPRTTADGASRVGRRILEALRSKKGVGPGEEYDLRSSIGSVTLGAASVPLLEGYSALGSEYFEAVAQSLIGIADEAMYRAKAQGGSRICHGGGLSWPSPKARL